MFLLGLFFSFFSLGAHLDASQIVFLLSGKRCEHDLPAGACIQRLGAQKLHPASLLPPATSCPRGKDFHLRTNTCINEISITHKPTAAFAIAPHRLPASFSADRHPVARAFT